MDLRTRLLGSWRLASSDWHDDDGNVVVSPLGPEPVGLLTYDASGTVSVQMMRPHQQPFAESDWRLATAAERAAAWIAYFCYFGTFTVDEEAGRVTHAVEGSWFPNLVGTEQGRSCRFSGGRLYLTADTPLGRITLGWEKV